ncbi:MAG: beta 1,4 glucosyltransferase [Patescibacteria group bacterium]|nr:MAG: beta 1,4 glucosyltransferase [Patescibacteria group bacterium]
MPVSIALAVFNEESNLHYSLDSTIEWADEIVIVDGGSTDKTVLIAKTYGKKVKVIETHNNPTNFHINKQLALDNCKNKWVLQLDADEEVSKELKHEIINITQMNNEEIEKYQNSIPDNEKKLFLRHQSLVLPKMQTQKQEHKIYAGFFVPRLNNFLGKFMRYGGLYPDAPIRLIDKNKAYFPCKDVHEVIEVKGKIGWLRNPLLHYDSPTFDRYISRNNRYVHFLANQLRQNKTPKNFRTAIDYIILKPTNWFVLSLIRHKGILDGWRGVVFAFFSAIRFCRAYLLYISDNK